VFGRGAAGERSPRLRCGSLDERGQVG